MSLILTAGKCNAITLLRASVYSGEPLIFPTDTVYGIGAPISSLPANKKVYGLKKRPQDQPMPVLIGGWEQLSSLAAEVGRDVLIWLKNAWTLSNPVRYTVILKAAPWLPAFYTKNGNVAVRMTVLPWLADAILTMGTPVTATSVNVSGEMPLNNASEIAEKFLPVCKFMLWGESGDCHASTIVDLTGKDLKVVRV
ncbi:MAG: Sua5/YciO/YrdC/YwlC family protein [Deferribacteraceae bacterium]|jgi:L-threonylcarbamoyladenylate synthase|nr:Sua5/YciO/YrdC/YwlC family protein [Deferribacteraceae bacterium]